MPERIEKEGKKFWKFPELPYDVGQVTRRLYNYYMRTNPETGLVHLEQWAVYPNNSTPRTLGPLLTMLATITLKNSIKLNLLVAGSAGNVDYSRMTTDHDRWNARLNFYQAKIAELMEIDPDAPMGGGTGVGKEIGRFVSEPLFLGWFPHDVAPFTEQPPPYSSQIGQSVMDIYSPFTMANQLAIADAAVMDAYVQFKVDIKEATEKFFTETLPGLPGLDVLPYVVAGAIGLGVYSWIKK